MNKSRLNLHGTISYCSVLLGTCSCVSEELQTLLLWNTLRTHITLMKLLLEYYIFNIQENINMGPLNSLQQGKGSMPMKWNQFRVCMYLISHEMYIAPSPSKYKHCRMAAEFLPY